MYSLKKTNRVLLCSEKLCVSLHSHLWNRIEIIVRKCSNRIQIINFSASVTYKFDGCHWKTTGHLLYVHLSFVHNFLAICEFQHELQSWNTQIGSKFVIFISVTLKCEGWPWKTICKSKLVLWCSNAQIGTKIVLTCDLDLSPSSWTSLLSMVITHENFMMVWWQEHCEKGVTDRRKGPFIDLLGHS